MKQKMNKILSKLHIALPYIILVISNIILCVAYYIIKVLKEVNFYEMIYYFTSETAGTSPDIILDGIKTCFFIFIIIMILLIIPISNYKKASLTLKIKKKKVSIYPNVLRFHKIAYSLFFLIVSIMLLLKTMNFDEYIINSNKKSDIYETLYKNTNDVKITFPENKKNLILIYLESMETSLVKEENGGTFKESRIPELEALALENLNFSNTDKLGGAHNLTMTAWTLAATVGGTSGTPLLPSIRNGYRKVEKFMPNVTTLGDVLKREGYNLEVIQGSNINFAGTKKYFSQHGDYKMFDLKEAKRRELIPEDYYVWWGIEDKKLFEYAKTEITEISSKPAPFAVSLFTMDTHFKDGYLDETCETPFKDQMSNVYACSSKMINNFINWLKEQPFYENTTIILIGDHITMQNEYYNDYHNYTRTIYNAFLNTKVEPKSNKNREFTSLDMYPTILASLGANIEGDQLGFGVNLFSDKETIVEELGLAKFNYELLKKSDYYMKEILRDPILDKK